MHNTIMQTLKKYLTTKEFIVRLIVVTLIISGIVINNGYRFYLILFSGIILGVYYGLYNDMIWRPNGKLEDSFPYRSHQVWIHIICGAVGSVALFYLLSVVNIENPLLTIDELGGKEFTLFGIFLLSYVGLLPRVLWYLSYAQQNMFKSK